MLETPTLPDILAARAASEPETVAMIVHGSGELTFGRWQARSNAVAHDLLNRGVRRGDRVGLVYPGSGWIDYAVAFLGVLKAGAVAVPMSDRMPAAEIEQIAAHCSASVILTGRDGPPPEGGAGSSTSPPEGRAGSSTSPPEGSRPPLEGSMSPPEVTLRPADMAQILYTSGTTGKAKGVAATHANLAFGARTQPRRRAFAHSRHLVHAFPIGTNAGQMMLVNALTAHPAVVTLPRFTPGRFAALIERHRAGTVFLVPAMAVELLNLQEGPDLSSVLLLGSAAAPLPPAVASGLTRMFPKATITNYYTSTEAAPAQTIMLFDPDRPDSVGRSAAGGDVRIASPEGADLPPGQTGEVWMRSPAAPRSYYDDPAASTEVFRGGWIRMGDLGYLDDDGYLYLVDRDGDVVKSGAFKVSTLKVENALYEHPAVVEAAAYGLPHHVLGTTVAAAVVLRTEVPDADIRAFLRDRLAQHEIPSEIVRMESLPRNRGGKVDKRALRARA
ncbi:class I adenylate-forming enzyme family protein [Planotetraspora phitsanulokensis]|uniref:O-succinylbenzoic acid--CoA ligase n=1 Tax=Planotetraspora phitsanulokensis TaxID=575192 RepID=A0A8J3XJT7_9ACTN|nr:class I adenylate-forming enzyme family protein [Planotetraspora phitsanulokensis]GII38868.1 O-succinylbenzoic acid--CoA ligase [Planotetraspora phitsanulokensis]